ncbi:MAG: phage virion morphogenesis protein, partial [Bacteroidales bacterium]|nr:phage virion morphogenesis protein [Bacteroidales bacterium]
HAKGADGRRKILTGKTGNLGRSIKYRIEPHQVIIFSDVKYAKAHNEGDMTGRNHKVKMPKRQFIGSHPVLKNELEKIINNYIYNIFK